MLWKEVMRFSSLISSVTLFAVTTLGVATAAWASGLRPPIQNSGAVTTPDGIQVAVLGQSCSQTVDTDQPGNDLVEMTVQIEVRNRTPQTLGVHRDGFRLTGADGRSIPTSTWFASKPMSLAPRQVQTFELRFMSRGGLSCSKEMTLESLSSIVRGTEPAKIGAIRFVARSPLAGY
jgi:hypothetical protein